MPPRSTACAGCVRCGSAAGERRFILWLRQLKLYFRSRARMIGALGQPTLFLLALGFGLGPTSARAGSGDYVQFLAPGIVTMGILFNAVFSGIGIIWDRHFGFLKETLVAPVPRLEIVLGRTLGSATVALIQGSIVFSSVSPPASGRRNRCCCRWHSYSWR
jgi:ABC-2 type transport system permease protein